MEELAKVQAPQEELKQYISLTSLQTKGLKRHFRDEKFGVKSIERSDIVEKEQSDDGEVSINAIKGAKRKRMSLINQGESKKSTSDDPNCVGLNVSRLYQIDLMLYFIIVFFFNSLLVKRVSQTRMNLTILMARKKERKRFKEEQVLNQKK